jgi:hypothetical protein
MYKTKTRTYECNICNNKYASSGSLWSHNKKFHNDKLINIKLNNTISEVSNKIVNEVASEIINDIANEIINDIASKVDKNIKCKFCNKNFNFRQNKYQHEKRCKTKINMLEENKKIKEEIDNIKIISKKEPSIIHINNDINTQLINLIVDQTKRIEDLQTKINTNEETKINTNEETKINTNEETKININEETKININKELSTLSLNNTVIISRSSDNYINANQLCQAGGKKFNNWYLLNTTIQLISILESKTKIPSCELIEVNTEDCWIHPVS